MNGFILAVNLFSAIVNGAMAYQKPQTLFSWLSLMVCLLSCVVVGACVDARRK